MAARSPLWELTIARTKEFFRQPEAVFWVYVFPILLMVGLGVAFRGGGGLDLQVAVTDPERCAELSRLLGEGDIRLEALSEDEARAGYSAGRIDLIVSVTDTGYRYTFDPTRTGAEAAKLRVNDALQRLAPHRMRGAMRGSRYFLKARSECASHHATVSGPGIHAYFVEAHVNEESLQNESQRLCSIALSPVGRVGHTYADADRAESRVVIIAVDPADVLSARCVYLEPPPHTPGLV